MYPCPGSERVGPSRPSESRTPFSVSGHSTTTLFEASTADGFTSNRLLGCPVGSPGRVNSRSFSAQLLGGAQLKVFRPGGTTDLNRLRSGATWAPGGPCRGADGCGGKLVGASSALRVLLSINRPGQIAFPGGPHVAA